MPATPIVDPASGESLVGTEPQLQQQVDPGWWRQRLNLYTGRTLSVTALDGEQGYRGGLLATLGQSVTAGTISGLVLTLDMSGADPLLVVTPGYGITASGQDVVLNATLKAHLSTLAVIDAVTGVEMYDFHQSVGDPTNSTYAGILLLQPVIAQVSGQMLDTGTLPIEVSGNLGASCYQDPSEYAFEDWQIADAVRLVYLPWPKGVPALPLPAKDPVATWRNRLAYAIFEAESLLGPDDQLPWAMLGLPVGLIAFDPGVAWTAKTGYTAGQYITDPNSNLQLVTTAGTSGATQPASWNTVYGGTTTDGGVTWKNNGLAWSPLFVDCSAVVRAGGLPRNRHVLPSLPLPLMQWQSDTDFVADEFIIDGNQNIQVVQTGGTSGGPPPKWPTTFGTTTPDGTVTWIENGPSSWQPNTAFAAGQFIFDSDGNMQHVLTAGISGSKAPVWNGIYLPTADGSVTWINNGSGNPPVIQPALAQARINQLSEQLSQTMALAHPFNTLADIFPTLPPSGILPVDALNFPQQRAPWLPPNWSVSAAPVRLEELETVLETGMSLDLLAAETSAPEDAALLEPVEVLVPLPDALYDPDILVVETVAPVFYKEVAQATQARNLTLQQLQTVQQETNQLFAAVGPNQPANPNVINPNAGLTPDELTGRNTPPPYTPAATETFGTVLQTTWLPSNAYSVGQFVIDSNGVLQVVQAAGSSGSQSPSWNTTEGQTTQDGMIWVNSGNATWQPNTSYAVGQLIFDAAGNIQFVQSPGVSGASAPTWNATAGQQTEDPAPAAGQSATANTVIWNNLGRSVWTAGQPFQTGQAIVDANGFIQFVQVGGLAGPSQPAWSTTAGATTIDAPLTWINNGPWAWQPNTAYVAGQFIVDPGGFMQVVSTPGTSASAAPAWIQPETAGQTVQDGTVIWQAGGRGYWQPNQPYTAGQLILDGNNNIEIVQTAGTSGPTVPIWDPNPGQLTQEQAGTAVWSNLGHATWQPQFNYSPSQAIIDSTGSIQTATNNGTTASSPPSWLQPEATGQTTQDGIIWQSAGSAKWQPDFPYTAGQLILDSSGIQLVQIGGISGDSDPSWNSTLGQTTQDSGVVWQNLGRAQWQPGTSYSAGQAVLDLSGNIQVATVGGTSGASHPAWTEGANATSMDAAVIWTNKGPLTWQPGASYAAGQIVLDSNNSLQVAGAAGTSGTNPPVWNTTPTGTTTDGAIIWTNLAYDSSDLLQLKAVVSQAPYTRTFTDSTGTAYTISLLSTADLTNLSTNGLQTLITSLNARISQANDLLDTAFLTVQTDIYRYRQNILGATAATTLATSPVLANIATGETASATADNLQTYIGTLVPTTAAPTPGTVPSPPKYPVSPNLNPVIDPVVLSNRPIFYKSPLIHLEAKPLSLRSRAITEALGSAKLFSFNPGIGSTINLNPTNLAGQQQAASGATGSPFKISDTNLGAALGAQRFLGNATLTQTGVQAGPAQIIAPGVNTTATTTDITSQSPLAGAQLNIRTLTIAERLGQSPSQEAMFYSIGNRLSFLQALQMLENDLNLVADDLPILVDSQPTLSTPPLPTPTALQSPLPTFSEWLGPTNPHGLNYPNHQATIMQLIQSPYMLQDSSEATLFSVGVRVAEQHTMLLRALEARVQQYSDFVTLCTNALTNIQNNIQQAQTYTTQLNNNLLQDRQNVAFTSALLSDETQRVQGVNTQRQQVLATAVQLVAYTRARTLEATDTAPSRQLVPANVTNPVPACLQQSVAIPPEIREIVGQLREAPVNWLPSVSSQVGNLERPILLQQLAFSAQARAAQLLQLPLLPSSAAGESGVYASTISTVYSANQQVFRGFMMQRAAIQPAALVNLSWSGQVASVQSIAAVNDLISAESVHTEISNAVARLVQQISSVATCLYTRVSIALPIDRLAWAEYLRGAGLSVQLQSLGVLPSWNQLSYTDRQQMQMLVDWLFLQIDNTNSAVMAFMSDVVRTAILLASDVPIDNIISGNVIARTQPVIGGIVSLNLPSERISSGMYVNLYSGAALAARGVVSDLDNTTVSATVTDVFTPGTYLETSDTAHFTTLTPQAVALRPLFM
ncbi:MAG: hypothetical protein ABSC76_09585 [Terracidiphilus sp.]